MSFRLFLVVAALKSALFLNKYACVSLRAPDVSHLAAFFLSPFFDRYR